MKGLFDSTAPKTSVNLLMNSDLLTKSQALNINLSALLEKALSQHLAEHARTEWVEQNCNAIQSYNEFVEANGCFSDEYRIF
jgi:antitoxin CcdA